MRFNAKQTVEDAGPYNYEYKKDENRRFSTSIQLNLCKVKVRYGTIHTSLIFSFSVLPKSEALDAGDLVQKSSADEREAYKGTLSEETAIENENRLKGRKPQVFNLNSIKFLQSKSEVRNNLYLTIFSFSVMPKSTNRGLADKTGTLNTLYKISLTEEIKYDKGSNYHHTRGILDCVYIKRKGLS